MGGFVDFADVRRAARLSRLQSFRTSMRGREIPVPGALPRPVGTEALGRIVINSR